MLRGGSRRLGNRLADHLGLSDDDRARFVEGIIVGAFVGAAIGGSTLWSRVRRRSHRESMPLDAAAAPAGAGEPGPRA